MIEDESDKYSYTVGCQHLIVSYRTEVVGFQGEVESLRNDEVAAEKRGEGEESLLVENGIVFLLPVATVAIQKQHNGLASATDGQTGVGHGDLERPVKFGQEAAPAITDVAAVVKLSECGNIALASNHPMPSQMDSNHTSKSDRRASDLQIDRGKVSRQKPRMNHHPAIKSLVHFSSFLTMQIIKNQ